MDQEWTTGIESLLLNRAKVAEGVGFESFHDSKRTGLPGRLGASPRLAGFESHPASASLRARVVTCKNSW